MYPDISRAGDVVWPRPNDDDLEQDPAECPHIQADDGSRGDTRHPPPGTAIVPAAPKYFLGFGNIFSVI